MASQQVFSGAVSAYYRVALMDPDNLEAGPGYTPGLVVPQLQANPAAIRVATRGPDDPVNIEVWVGIVDTLNEGWHSLFLGEIVASKGRLAIGPGVGPFNTLLIEPGSYHVRVDVRGIGTEVDVVRFSFPDAGSIDVAT
jgi:hypothetical protein